MDYTSASSLIDISKKKVSQKPVMLMATINCSIGSNLKHLKLEQVKALLSGKEPSNIFEKYALKTIKTEASTEEIAQFVNYYKISLKKVEKVLHNN